MPTPKIKITKPKNWKLEVSKKSVRKALTEVAKETKADTIAAIQAHAGPTVSKPGEYPHGKTGQLANSMVTKVKKWRALVIDKAKYSKALEAGATGGGPRKGVQNVKGTIAARSNRVGKKRIATSTRRMEPRPFLSQTKDKLAKDGTYDQIFQKVFKDLIDLKINGVLQKKKGRRK